MAEPSSDQNNDITFISGIDQNGLNAQTSYANWNDQTPPGYSSTQGFVHKWGNDANGSQVSPFSSAGVGGGTVTYSFDPGVTADEQSAFQANLALWSDEANISFKPVSSGVADLVLDVTTSGDTSNLGSPQQYSIAGSPSIPTEYTPDKQSGQSDIITFNNDGSYGTLGSFTDMGGYGVAALNHELGT